MINPIAPLSNSASTITPSYISIFSSLIFTVTSLSISLLFRLQQVVLFITLESIVNLFLLLRLNQELLSLGPHLNYIHSLPQPIFAVHYSYYSYILVLFFSQFCFLFPNSYSILPYDQISHNCNNFYFLDPPPWHRDPSSFLFLCFLVLVGGF